jgi:hypothetical protein
MTLTFLRHVWKTWPRAQKARFFDWFTWSWAARRCATRRTWKLRIWSQKIELNSTISVLSALQLTFCR